MSIFFSSHGQNYLKAWNWKRIEFDSDIYTGFLLFFSNRIDYAEITVNNSTKRSVCFFMPESKKPNPFLVNPIIPT